MLIRIASLAAITCGVCLLGAACDQLPTAPTPPAPAPDKPFGFGPVTLTWIPGSSVKLEQMIGDTDRQTGLPTRSQTFARYQVGGTDLGYSFEHGNRLLFLFGDTLYFHAGDTMAWSNTFDPGAGILLNFFTNKDGSTLLVQPPGISMGAFEVPDSGISLGDRLYVVCKTNHTVGDFTDQSVLTRFDPSMNTFTVGRTISSLPDGKFIEMALHTAPLDCGIPGPAVLIWGSGKYRESDVYFATVPAADFESGVGTRYFAGLVGGVPTWTDQEQGAVPVVQDGTIGNVSVTHAPAVGLWLMTYDSRLSPKGIRFRYAKAPWGPWSDPQLIFDPSRDGGYGHFIHDPTLVPDDGLGGPTIGGDDPATTFGGDYAPYVMERFTRAQGGKLVIHYVMSTFNPYTVVHMRSEFAIGR
jgi:hypothetical protein